MAGQMTMACGLEVLSLKLLTFILLGTLTAKGQVQAVAMVCPDDRWMMLPLDGSSGKTACILPSPSPLNMRQASLHCEGEDATLVIPHNQHYQDKMREDAQTRGWEDMWINAKGANRMWNWDLPTGKAPLQLQGCWRDDIIDPDLEIQVKPANMSVEACALKCMTEGYTKASVQIAAGPNREVVCRCGNLFGKYDRLPWKDCESRCPATPSGSPFDNLCGGIGAQTIFIVSGLPSSLPSLDTSLHQAALERPYWDIQKVGDCAAMTGNNVKWHQKSCHEKHKYICQYPFRTCMETSREESEWFGDTCVTFHTTSLLSWFHARESCMNLGGKLLSLDGVSRDRLSNSDMGSMLGSSTWWIGLTIYTWRQANGAPLPPYNGWRPGEPLYKDNLLNVCVQAWKNDDFKWSTSNCNDMKHFYCMKNSTVPTLPGTPPPLTSTGPGPTPITAFPSTTRPYVTFIGQSTTPVTAFDATRPPITFIDVSATTISTTESGESTSNPTGNPQPQAGLGSIFIGAIGAGVGVGFVLLLIGIWCCCRRCSSDSTDSSKERDDSGKPRRLPSIPGGGRGVHRIKGKTVRYLSDPALSLNHLPAEDVEDDGEYDYIDIALKKDDAGEEDGVKYEGLTDSMREKKYVEAMELEYEGLHPNGGLPEDNYIIPIEPPKVSDGVAPPVVEATNEKPPLGMSMPKKVPKTVEASLRIRDSSRDSNLEPVSETKPPLDTKDEKAVSTVTDVPETAVTMESENVDEPEYADMPAVEDSGDENISPPNPVDDEDIPDEAKVDSKAEIDNKSDTETDNKLSTETDNKSDTDVPSESVIEMEKTT